MLLYVITKKADIRIKRKVVGKSTIHGGSTMRLNEKIALKGIYDLVNKALRLTHNILLISEQNRLSSITNVNMIHLLLPFPISRSSLSYRSSSHLIL